MSAIDSDFSSSDYASISETESKPSLHNMFPPDWIIIKLTDFGLYPQKYQLRHIEEKGSISDSLRAAKINIFDRVRCEENWFLDTLRKVASFAIVFFATPYSYFIGVLYNGSMIVKHLVIMLICKKEDAANNWKKVRPTIPFFLVSLILCILLLIITRLGMPRIFRFFAIAPMGLLNGLNLFFNPDLLAVNLNNRLSYSCFYKSLVLRREFGIVNKSGGYLLNWDPAKDKDLLFSYSCGFDRHAPVSNLDLIKDNWDLIISSGNSGNLYYELTGYFGNLHIEQGRQFVSLIKELQSHLPQGCKFGFSYPPTAEKLADFLEKNRAVSGLSDAEVLEWKQKFTTLKEEMTLIENLLSNIAGIIVYNRLPISFPLDEEACLTQLKEDPPQKT